MRLNMVFFAHLLSKVISQINTSADLNCSFESTCRWRNDTSGEDSGDFPIASSVRMGNRFNIIPLKNGSNEMFAYTHGPFEGLQRATLISDTISCQLGGGSLAFWYYRTGDLATLEVCVRQPPSSLNFADLRCFPVFPKNHAHRWLLNVVEFPPLTQPFELLIRSHYIQPFDVIAIDDVFYDAALCGQGNNLLPRKLRTTGISYEPGRNQHMRSQRDAEHASHVPSSSSFASLPLTDYHNLKILKDSDVKPSIALVVGTRRGKMAEMFHRISQETPSQMFPSSVIENRNKALAKGPIESMNMKRLITNFNMSDSWELFKNEGIAVPLVAAVYSKQITSNSKSDEKSISQQTYTNFFQKFTPLIFSTLVSVSKSWHTFSPLSNINGNGSYVQPSQGFYMDMKQRKGNMKDFVNRFFSQRQVPEALKIERIPKNIYGISRKLHADFEGSDGTFRVNKSQKMQTKIFAAENMKETNNYKGNDIDSRNAIAVGCEELEILRSNEKELPKSES